MTKINLNQPGVAEALTFTIAYVFFIIWILVLIACEMMANRKPKKNNRL